MRSKVSTAPVLLGLVLCATLFGGCQSKRTAYSAVTPSYISLYRSGDYDGSLRAAKAFPTSHHGSERLIAGMSLAALDKPEEAKIWLQPLTSSSDRNIRGRAKASMGLILADENAHQDAARLLDQASSDLAGPQSGWAAHYGAQEFTYAGDNLRSERLRSVATLRGPSDPDAKLSGNFTVQLGSFTSRSRAQSRVRDTTLAATNAGLDSPRVEMTMAGSKPFYAVRVGRFGTSADAQAASDKFPGDTAIIRFN
jgi:hypothetical protein